MTPITTELREKRMMPADWSSLPSIATSHIKVARTGLGASDRIDLEKLVGSSSMPLIKSALTLLQPHELPIFSIGLGCTEKYGFNRNFDAFGTAACRKYHDTFVKHGRWFRDHDNKPTSLHYGRHILTSFNEKMGRVEIVTGLYQNKEAAERNGSTARVADMELNSIESGDPIHTSMSCVLDPSTPVLTERGYVRIDEVVVGDSVLTHNGNWKKVTQLNRRVYTGEVLSIDVNGLPHSFELTADHPLFAKQLQEYPVSKNGQRPISQWQGEANAACGWLHATHLEKGDRIHHARVVAPEGTAAIADTRLGALLGLYLAEGSVQHQGSTSSRISGACFTVHVNDWAAKHLSQFIRSMWPDVSTSITPKANSKFALSLFVNSTHLGEWLSSEVGEGALNKRIPWSIFAASDEVKLAFLGRWLDGDGFCDKKGAHWSTASERLVLQGRDLLASMGIAASIYRLKHKSGYSVKQNRAAYSIEYTLNVSNLDAGPFAAFSEKAAASAHAGKQFVGRVRPACMTKVGDQYVYRVNSVTRRNVVDAQTYNFEVEDDRSYSLAGLSSHNCKIPYDVCVSCHHKAASPKDYCDEKTCKHGGCKNNLGRLYDDGTLQGVDNPIVTWFDLSNITNKKQADRIAVTYGAIKQAAAQIQIPERFKKAFMLLLEEEQRMVLSPEPVTAIERLSAKVAGTTNISNLGYFVPLHAQPGGNNDSFGAFLYSTKNAEYAAAVFNAAADCLSAGRGAATNGVPLRGTTLKKAVFSVLLSDTQEKYARTFSGPPPAAYAGYTLACVAASEDPAHAAAIVTRINSCNKA